MSAPTVSILIPVFNREQLIGPCIESALGQTYRDTEVVVVDNASTDRTADICREYAARDGRVRVFSNNENIGPVRNWLRCIEEARGSFGKILFSDDLLLPRFLEKTLPYLESERVGFVFTAVQTGAEPGAGELKYQFIRKTGVCQSELFLAKAFRRGDVSVSPGCALFRMEDLRRNLMLSIPSPSIDDFPSHGAGPDQLLFLLTARQYPSVAYVHEPLCFYRDHAGSISNETRRDYLLQCYRQARLWFAETHMDAKSADRLYAYEWKRECKERKKWRFPSDVLRKYTDKPMPSLAAIVEAFLVK